MTGPMDPAARYTLAGEPGAWRFVGQAFYVDDDGRRVEHDWLRMVRRDVSTGATFEVWVDPAAITGVMPGRTSHGVFVLGDSTVAG